jgi:hypothetical protein
MTEQRRQDEALLMDFLAGRCTEAAQDIHRRLERDSRFRALHDDIANALAGMRLAPELEPPADLAARAMERIDRHHRTEALVAREELHHRGFFRPTFSLRELAAAAVAAVVLVAVFLPSMYQARRQAAANLCASHQGQLGAGISLYAEANNGFLPAASAPQGRWLPADGQGAASNSSGPFKLVSAGYVPPVTFQCPAVSGGSPAGFALQAGMNDFPTGKFINYSYQHTLGGGGICLSNPILAKVAQDMAILADETPMFVDGRFRPDHLNAPASPNHSGSGQNVLYLDMHSQWADGPAVGVGGDHIYLVKGINNYRGDEAPSEPTDSFLLPSYTGGK